ncbi:MAG: YigZ family protein [Oscillospiraceae bacterium]|nr:YigZ family protein [Oscillospiraceae bacterium]MDD4413386.1 YigZ family protein [Oscillospiraceae bacterium]
MEGYLTIKHKSVCEFTEKRSRFLGAVSPVKTEDEAIEFIDARRKEYWNATHNVYAYVLREGQIRRYSDDGEPQGTAGLPVLNVLIHEKLTDCVAVITRYFGGVLLGTGGLVRAYAHSTKLAVDQGGIIHMQLCIRGVIKCDYNMYGRISSLLPEIGGRICDTQFSDCVEIEFIIPRKLMNILNEKLTQISSGSLKAEEIGQEYAQV